MPLLVLARVRGANGGVAKVRAWVSWLVGARERGQRRRVHDAVRRQPRHGAPGAGQAGGGRAAAGRGGGVVAEDLP
eukprot:scaffold99021_cov48-Phaeocystis_antarctica.AAC.1